MTSKYKVALEYFKKISQNEPSSWPDSQWHGNVDNCDVCSRPMCSEKFMVDGPVSKDSRMPWGNLCVVCAHKSSDNIGWGKAQLYKKTPDGAWQLVSGGPPEESM